MSAREEGVGVLDNFITNPKRLLLTEARDSGNLETMSYS